MKNKFLKTIGTMALAILMPAMFTQISVTAQDTVKQDQSEELTVKELFRLPNNIPTLEGSWSVQVTIRNCQTNAAITNFPAMNTFMQGGTMQEFSAGSGFLRGPGHGVWSHNVGNFYDFSFQFFRFNADGTNAGITKAKRRAELEFGGFNYTATSTIEVFNPSGIRVATACATETATRFLQ